MGFHFIPYLWNERCDLYPWADGENLVWILFPPEKNSQNRKKDKVLFSFITDFTVENATTSECIPDITYCGLSRLQLASANRVADIPTRDIIR